MPPEYSFLSDVADIIVGYPFESEQFNTERIGVKLVRGMNVTTGSFRWGEDTRWWSKITAELEPYYLKTDDIIIGMDGSRVGKNYAKVRESDLPLLLVQRVACIRAKSGVDQDYLWSCIASSSFEEYIDLIKTGTTIPHISSKQIGEFPVPRLDLKTQQVIGKISRLLNSKIYQNEKINDNLLNSLRSTIDNYFCYLPEDLPEGWKSCSLPDIASIITGYSYKGDELAEDSNDALVTIKNFDRTGGFKIEGYKPLSISDRVKQTQYVELFDIVVAHTDLTQGAEIIGNSEIILSKGGFDKLVASMDLVKIQPNNTIGRFLLAALLSNYQFKGHCLGYVNGTTVLHLSKDAVREYSLAIPDDTIILEKYNSYCEGIYRTIAHNMAENERLTALRDYLLPKLMSGEIDVSTLEIPN